MRITSDWFEKAYAELYDRLCGVPPDLRCWHFQWLGAKDLYGDLRRILPGLRGRVLDVGCGRKPYARWMPHVDPGRLTGIDIVPGPNVDAVVEPGKRWPFDDGSFDAVLCTQVLEHVSNLDGVFSEIYRVLAAGGTLVVTLPFLFGEHGAPDDYRRLTLHGVRRLISGQYEVVELAAQGRIGSTVGTLILGWSDAMLRRYSPTRVLRLPLLPLWIAFTLAVNGIGFLADRVDRTGAYYGNVLLVARKPVPGDGRP